MVNFESVEDYRHVLFEGPWMVADHYMLIQWCIIKGQRGMQSLMEFCFVSIFLDLIAINIILYLS